MASERVMGSTAAFEGSGGGRLNFALIPNTIVFKEWGLKQNEDSFSSRILLVQNTSDSEVSIVMQGPRSERFTMKSHTSAYPLMFLLSPRETARYTITFVPPKPGEEDHLWDCFRDQVIVHSRMGNSKVDIQAFRKDVGTSYIADDVFAPVRGVCPPPPLSKLFQFVESQHEELQEPPPPLPPGEISLPSVAAPSLLSPREKQQAKVVDAADISLSDAKEVIRMLRMRNNANKQVLRPSSSASVLSDVEWKKKLEEKPLVSSQAVQSSSNSNTSHTTSPSPVSVTPRERDEVLEFNKLVVMAKIEAKEKKKQVEYHTKLLMRSLHNGTSTVVSPAQSNRVRDEGGFNLSDSDSSDDEVHRGTTHAQRTPQRPREPPISRAISKSIDFTDSDDDESRPFQGTPYKGDDDDGLALSDDENDDGSWIQEEYNRRLHQQKCTEEAQKAFSPADPKLISVHARAEATTIGNNTNRNFENGAKDKSTFQTSFKPGQRIKVVPRAMKSKQRYNFNTKKDEKSNGVGWNASRK